MGFLDPLSPVEKEVVISLPYRVGMWLSLADSDGGEEADKKEREVLENLINGFTQEVFGSELVQHIMSATWNAQDRWPKWSERMQDVLPHCQMAMMSLTSVYDEKEVNAFRQRLFEIAEAVAQAFQEEGNEFSLSNIMDYYVHKLKSKMGVAVDRQWDYYKNVSPKEREALEKLAKILEIQNNE